MQEDDVFRIANRHKARLLTKLEDAKCPNELIEIVKGELNWLRSDLIKDLRHDHSATDHESVAS